MTRTCRQPGRLVARVHSPACVFEPDTAGGDVIRARQLDNLYRQALSLATQSYCQG